MNTISCAVAKRIMELCDQNGITVNKLSLMCGITQSTLSNIVNGNSRNPQISTIKKVCDGLDMTLSDFFNTPYFDSLEQEVM